MHGSYTASRHHKNMFLRPSQNVLTTLSTKRCGWQESVMHGSYTASRHPTDSDSDLQSSDPARAAPAAKPAQHGHPLDVAVPGEVRSRFPCRGNSLIPPPPLLGPYSRTILRVLW